MKNASINAASQAWECVAWEIEKAMQLTAQVANELTEELNHTCKLHPGGSRTDEVKAMLRELHSAVGVTYRTLSMGESVQSANFEIVKYIRQIKG